MLSNFFKRMISVHPDSNAHTKNALFTRGERREDGELEDLDEDDDPEDDDVAADEPATAPAVSSPTAQD